MTDIKDIQRTTIVCLTESLTSVLEGRTGPSAITPAIMDLFSVEFLTHPETILMFQLVVSISTAAAYAMAEHPEDSLAVIQKLSLSLERLYEENEE